MKYIHQGDAVYSLLTILDIICGAESVFRTVCGKAEMHTVVAK